MNILGEGGLDYTMGVFCYPIGLFMLLVECILIFSSRSCMLGQPFCRFFGSFHHACELVLQLVLMHAKKPRLSKPPYESMLVQYPFLFRLSDVRPRDHLNSF